MDGKKSTKDREMSAAEIRFALEETENAFNHLERSQTELKEYLEVEEDEEISKAYLENKHVLVKKRARAKELYELLEKVDPAYFVENMQALKLIKDHLAFESLTDDEIQASNLMLRELNSQGHPIEIVMNGERQYETEQRILHREVTSDSDTGLYL